MGDSRLLLGCVKCGKAQMICRLSLGYEAWIRAGDSEEDKKRVYAAVYGDLLTFMNEHIQSECAYSEVERLKRDGEGGVLEASRDIFRLAIEEDSYYSEKHGWLLGEHAGKYELDLDKYGKAHIDRMAEVMKYKPKDLLRETDMIQRYDNGTGDCVSSSCDGKIDLVTRAIVHPCDPECWFERVKHYLEYQKKPRP